MINFLYPEVSGPYLSHLSENDIAFSLNGLLVQVGLLQDVRQDVHCERHILLEDLGEVAGHLARGEGVEVTPNVFDLLLQLLQRP